MPQSAPTQPSGNGNAAPTNTANDDFLSNVNDVLAEDEDMYDVTGDDTDGADRSDGGVDDSRGGGDTERAVQQQTVGQQEPELPIQFPTQQRPAPTAYDQDNPRGYQRVGTLFADAEGNIVSRDGRIMAAKGEPARHWFNLSKQAAQVPVYQRQAEALNGQIAGMQSLVAAAKELNELPQRLGISKEDYNTGVQLIASWNRDPLTVCRDMVARTMARGFNATDILGNEAGNAIEMSALRQMVNEATAGQRQREQETQTETENRRNAEANYNAFMARYPDAHTHQSAIATLMREQRITATEAYHELRYFALENQLDFGQPLGPQLAARQRAQQPQQRDPTYRAPMVNGNGGGRRDHLTNEPALADPSSSWGDILNSVMRQSA